MGKADTWQMSQKKDVKTNHVRLSVGSPDSRTGEYEPDTEITEELDSSSSIRTYKTTVGCPRIGYSRHSNSL